MLVYEGFLWKECNFGLNSVSGWIKYCLMIKIVVVKVNKMIVVSGIFWFIIKCIVL